MPTAQRNLILDNVVIALQAISGAPDYFYTVDPESVTRILMPVDRITIFPALFVTEGNETSRWQTVGPQLLTNIFEIVIWGYARADGSIAIDATHAKEALLHDVEVALAAALEPGDLNGTIVDFIPSGTTLSIETDEGLAAFFGAPDVGVFRMRLPVIYRRGWGQP
ncbi:MAG TPA: hypothetical protein VMB26_01925 [Candidatus Binataceae bacterium]|nr:hypothetical protein [Candidatus Binataceae bacterium]